MPTNGGPNGAASVLPCMQCITVKGAGMKRFPWWVWVAGVLVIALAVGGGVLIGRHSGSSPESGEKASQDGETTTPPEVQQPEEEGPPVQQPAETMTVRVYLVRGEKLGVALRQVPKSPAVARAAVEQLLSGATSAETGYGLSSQVPPGTKLLGLTVNNGVARVDLSGEFASGGGSLSVTLRLAQLVYTLTQFPSVQRVELMMDGQPIDVFTGEGIIVSLADTRADFETVLPAIFVEGPTPGETVTSPLRLWGTANVFEASFVVRVKDVNGNVVIEEPVMATSGTGTRGTFDVPIVYPDAAAPIGSVTVYESSAKDGSEINVVEIPVRGAK